MSENEARVMAREILGNALRATDLPATQEAFVSEDIPLTIVEKLAVDALALLLLTAYHA